MENIKFAMHRICLEGMEKVEKIENEHHHLLNFLNECKERAIEPIKEVESLIEKLDRGKNHMENILENLDSCNRNELYNMESIDRASSYIECLKYEISVLDDLFSDLEKSRNDKVQLFGEKYRYFSEDFKRDSLEVLNEIARDGRSMFICCVYAAPEFMCKQDENSDEYPFSNARCLSDDIIL